MKKILLILLTVIMCIVMCACSSKEFEDAQKAVDSLHRISMFTDFYGNPIGLNEHAEIIHNEWSEAYEATLNLYNSLSEEEQAKIENYEYLTEKPNYVSEYEEILAKREVILECKSAAVEELKESLINTSSYEEYDWFFDEEDSYFYSDGEFHVEIEIKYSATNTMGGRIDSTKYAEIRGTYKNGIINIENMN